MTAINKDTLKQIRADLNAALKTVTAKHGIDFNLGIIRFTASEFRCKLNATARGTSKVTVDPKVAALSANTWRLGSGYKPNAVYNMVGIGRAKFVGYNRSAKKYPYIVQVVGSTKRYKVSPFSAKAAVDAGVVA